MACNFRNVLQPGKDCRACFETPLIDILLWRYQPTVAKNSVRESSLAKEKYFVHELWNKIRGKRFQLSIKLLVFIPVHVRLFDDSFFINTKFKLVFCPSMKWEAVWLPNFNFNFKHFNSYILTLYICLQKELWMKLAMSR